VAPIATAYDYDVPAHFRGRGEEGRATGLELFFDLVFVFAVTQLSHALVEHLTWSGAAETLFLLLVVWWAWSYTTRMTNWLDPDSGPVRLLLIAMMAASLLMAIAITDAFGDRALLFAAGYVAVQVMRNAFMVVVSPPGSGLRASFARIAICRWPRARSSSSGPPCRQPVRWPSGSPLWSWTTPAPTRATGSR
jgi:low temperature requirement protein LtrA